MKIYIENKVQTGAGKDQIKEQVMAVGWTEEEFDKAYADALVATGVPVPAITRGNYTKRASVGDVVLNFFSFILLGIIVSALGTLYFAVINVFFSDKLSTNGYYSSYYYERISITIHYAISALVVSFPLYYLAVRMWLKRFREDETKIESKLTKWLTYLVLLGTSVTIVGDLITVLFTFLQGEITMRFILKALVVLVLAGMVFGFYFLERKKIQYRVDIPRCWFRVFGYVLAGMIILGTVFGLMASGGSSTERDRRFDEQRSQNLSQITSCITRYAQSMKQLPVTLTEMSSYQATASCGRIYDPETSDIYEYRVIKPLRIQSTGVQLGTIELCANFAVSSLTDKAGGTSSVNSNYYYDNNFLQHGKGRTCFTRQITVEKGY